MKKIEIKEEVINYKWEAADGTTFTSKEECSKYEQSAKGVLFIKYKDIVSKSGNAYDLMGFGSSEEYLDIVSISSQNDSDICMQLTLLHNEHLLKPEYKEYLDRINNLFKESLERNTPVLIYRGNDCEDSFYPNITLHQLIMNIVEKH